MPRCGTPFGPKWEKFLISISLFVFVLIFSRRSSWTFVIKFRNGSSFSIEAVFGNSWEPIFSWMDQKFREMPPVFLWNSIQLFSKTNDGWFRFIEVSISVFVFWFANQAVNGSLGFLSAAKKSQVESVKNIVHLSSILGKIQYRWKLAAKLPRSMSHSNSFRY